MLSARRVHGFRMDEEVSEALQSMKLLLMSLRKDDSRGGGTRLITTTVP